MELSYAENNRKAGHLLDRTSLLEGGRVMKRCIAALLTGRGNSTLKDKNVLSVLGHPLLWWPATAARHCCRITDFFCSSDDDAILSAAAECGYTGICRPAKLARPETQHADVIIHALEMMRSQGCTPDILVVLLANNGIVKSEWIEKIYRDRLNESLKSEYMYIIAEKGEEL